MKKEPLINILWDASPLWGHFVLNAVLQTGLSYSVIRAKDFSDKALFGDASPIRGKILIVPGGSGRLKAKVLGEHGKKCIRDFVSRGGVYIGFCGGAGLALTDESHGLALCPLGRDEYRGRVQHLVSGYIISSLAKNELIPDMTQIREKTKLSQDFSSKNTDSLLASLPVWWPGRIQDLSAQMEENGLVTVLARYKEIGHDLHVSDLPLEKLPKNALEDWANLYGVNIRPHMLDGQAAIVTGDFGEGKYILSYAHLETPQSPEANHIFAHILRTCLQKYEKNEDFLDISESDSPDCVSDFSFDIHRQSRAQNIFNTMDYCPKWLSGSGKNIGGMKNIKQEPLFPLPLNVCGRSCSFLLYLHEKMEELCQLGVDLHLLFPRTVWLYGWHSSVPGGQLNALRVALLQSLYLKTSESREMYFKEYGEVFYTDMLLFIGGAKSWLLARRLSETMDTAGALNPPANDAEEHAISKTILHKQRKELFGVQMSGGGLCGELIDWLNELLFV